MVYFLSVQFLPNIGHLYVYPGGRGAQEVWQLLWLNNPSYYYYYFGQSWTVREFPFPVIYFILIINCCTGSSLSMQDFSSCGEQASHCSGSSCCRAWALEHRLSGCGAWTWSLRDMSDLPGPGIEPASPALTCGLFTTGPPGQSSHWFLNAIYRRLMQTLLPGLANFSVTEQRVNIAEPVKLSLVQLLSSAFVPWEQPQVPCKWMCMAVFGLLSLDCWPLF